MTLRFEAFTFDSRSGQLRRDNHTIPLPGAASEVLCALLDHRPDMVSKEKLFNGSGMAQRSLRRACRSPSQNCVRRWRTMRNTRGSYERFTGKATRSSPMRPKWRKPAGSPRAPAASSCSTGTVSASS